ncbi:MAG: hypothetical protein LUC91_02715, partial [Prevotella sp.]|nr:hypothetical protein [Prevotella sp.]
MGVVDYGLCNVVGGVGVVFSYINNSMSTATSRFLSYELGRNDKTKVREIFANAFLLHARLALMVLILGETIGVYIVNKILSIPPDRLYACNVLYQFVIISVMLAITQVPFNSLIISHEKMDVYAYVGIIDAFAKCAVAYALCITPIDRIITYGALLTFVGLFIYVFYLSYCKWKFSDVINFTIHSKKDLMRQMFGFTLWGLLGSSANMLRNNGVNILINIFFGSAVNAANAIAYNVNAAITNFTNNFTMSMNPQIIKTYAAKDYENNKKLIFRGGRFSFFLLVLLCYPILFETEYILHLWLGDYPGYSAIFTRLVIILSMVEIFNPSIGCAVQATGKIKYYQIVI